MCLLGQNHVRDLRWRDLGHPRCFEKLSGSHVFLNHFFLISASEWFKEEGRMRSASVVPTSVAKKSGSESVTQENACAQRT